MSSLDVSVCIPAYESPDKIIRCIKSILIQENISFEIIITDDSITDSIIEKLNELNLSNKITYLKNNQRLGSPENWNKCISFAKGRYIKIMHQDDWFYKSDSLLKFVKA